MNLPKISNYLIEPYYPYRPYWEGIGWPYETWIGDFPPILPRDKKDEENYQKGLAEFREKILNPATTTNTIGSIFDKQVWFNNTDGNGQTFRLEVVGYGQEHISAEIKDSVLHVSGKRGQKSFTQQYQIPSPEKLDLNTVSAKVEYGLLEIVFSAKKIEVKSVKIL